ncbi:MAG: hypothetical protein OXN89_26545 [Bryobacterales bacterium]|nr:hypothetical protein [Bryobacterales bacterium]
MGPDLGSRLGIDRIGAAVVGYEAHNLCRRLLVYALRDGSRHQLATEHGHPVLGPLLQPKLLTLSRFSSLLEFLPRDPERFGLPDCAIPADGDPGLSAERVPGAMRPTRVSEP